MGLFKKFKDILFDEEEYTEQIKITPEMRNEDAPMREKPSKPVKEIDETKEEVRKIAESNNLINANKKDSYDICFITDKFREIKSG